jgi:hypothetical protein
MSGGSRSRKLLVAPCPSPSEHARRTPVKPLPEVLHRQGQRFFGGRFPGLPPIPVSAAHSAHTTPSFLGFCQNHLASVQFNPTDVAARVVGFCHVPVPFHSTGLVSSITASISVLPASARALIQRLQRGLWESIAPPPRLNSTAPSHRLRMFFPRPLESTDIWTRVQAGSLPTLVGPSS